MLHTGDKYERRARELRSQQMWAIASFFSPHAFKQRWNHARLTFNEVRNLSRFRKNAYFAGYTKQYQKHQADIRTDNELSQSPDGVVFSSTVKYQTTRDTRTGLLSTYWARNKEDFTPTDRENRIGLGEYRPIYHLATHAKGTDRQEIRSVIAGHHDDFRDFGIKSMSLVGGNLSNLYAKKEGENGSEKNNEVIGFTNEAFAVSVHGPQDSGDGWTVKLSRPYTGFKAVEGQLTEIDNFDSGHAIAQSFWTNGKPYGNYNSRAKALATMYMILNQRTQMIWAAEDPASITGFTFKNKMLGVANDIFTYGFSFFSNESKDFENKFEAVWDFVKTGIGYVGLRLVFPVVATTAVVLGFIDRKVQDLIKNNKNIIMYVPKGTEAIVGKDAAPYVADSMLNMKRANRRKPDVTAFPHQKLLSFDELDIVHSRAKRPEWTVNDKVGKEVCAQDGKGFSRLVMPLSTRPNGEINAAAEVSFNGLVRIARIREPDNPALNLLPQLASQDVDFYVGYIPQLDQNSRISISDEAKATFKDGRIIKYTEKTGTSNIEHEVIDFEQLKVDILSNCFGDHNDRSVARRFAASNLEWLFNQETTMSLPEDAPLRLTYEMREKPAEEVLYQVTARERLMALRHIFGSQAPPIEEPSAELIEYFEHAYFPMQSPIICSPHQERALVA